MSLQIRYSVSLQEIGGVKVWEITLHQTNIEDAVGFRAFYTNGCSEGVIGGDSVFSSTVDHHVIPLSIIDSQGTTLGSYILDDTERTDWVVEVQGTGTEGEWFPEYVPDDNGDDPLIPVDPDPISVTTGSVANILSNTAEFSGTLNIGGAVAANCWFQCATDNTFTLNLVESDKVYMTESGGFTGKVFGLKPETSYFFRAVGEEIA